MKTIYKYAVKAPDDPRGQFQLSLPLGAVVLDVQIRNGSAQMWAMVDLNVAETEERVFAVHGTGHEIADASRYCHISTFQAMSGARHLFEVVR